MTREQLIENIKKKKSFLCIGLDTDFTKLPKHLLSFEDPVFEFNKQIIDATKDFCVAYKPNTAFYETNGSKGWQSLEKTINYLNETCKDIFTIADAKRGDIGNTSRMYAKAFFETFNFDSVTVAPYMGEDSVTPFLEYKNKWVILLALTSNKGAFDFQTINLRKFDKPTDSSFLFEAVLKKSLKWGNINNMMYVAGATKAELLSDIRAIAPDHFLLIPGVGAQGGNLQDVAEYGMNKSCSILVNSSRAIIFADSSERFAARARKEAYNMQKEMAILLDKFCDL